MSGGVPIVAAESRICDKTRTEASCASVIGETDSPFGPNIRRRGGGEKLHNAVPWQSGVSTTTTAIPLTRMVPETPSGIANNRTFARHANNGRTTEPNDTNCEAIPQSENRIWLHEGVCVRLSHAVRLTVRSCRKV